MRTISFRILLLILILPIFTWAQNFHFEKITELEGLSDNRVTCFLKDATGFMWIGTENGLNRYDGYEFKIYRPGQSKQTLSHEYINDIEQDAKGRLWIGTWNGLNILDPKTDSLIVFSPEGDAYRQKKTKIASSIVWDSHIDKNQNIWLALDTRDLCVYDYGIEEFAYFPWTEFVNATLPRFKTMYKSIQKIERKSAVELWLGTSIGLFSFNTATKTFQYHGGDTQSDFVSMHFDSTHQRLLFGQDNLYSYDLQSATLRKIIQQSNVVLWNSQSETQILLSSKKGIWIIDRTGESAYQLPMEEKNPFTIQHDKVSTVLNDRGIVWIGTSGGIGIHDAHTDIFPFVRVFPDTSTLSAGNIFYVHEHSENYYITSYSRNSLLIINKLSGERKELFTIQGKPLTECTKIFEDSRHRIWILSKQSIFVSDVNQNNFKVFNYPNPSTDFGFIDMIEDKQGNYWFASLRFGVYHFNPTKNTWKLLQEKPDGLFASRPTALLSDPKNDAVWISDFSFGLFRHDLTTKEFVYHGQDANNPKLLQSALVNAITIDPKTNVWVATTSGGVSTYSQTKKVFTSFSMNTGLPENTVGSIQSDHHGNIWVTSSKGLTQLDNNGSVIKHYDKNSGLPFQNFSTPFSTNDRGEILIGIANGFLRFHPDSLNRSSHDFPIVITAMHQQDHSIQPNEEINYSHDQNEFTFEFAALTYALPRQVTYYYQLVGYDKDWINAGNSHEVHYTNLNNGSYVFNVKAVDHNGKISSNIATASFTIAPPFWKENWFIALLLAVIVTSLYLWRKNLQRKIESQKILNQVATSLYGRTTLESVFWSVAKSCLELLHFEDCVIYLLDEDRGVLLQKSVAGPKSSSPFSINQPLELKIGQGIVGSVAKTGIAEIIRNTSHNPRYIIDDQKRLSEITVPILVNGKVFAVLDSEHTKKNFFNRWHLHMLTEIARICSEKIANYLIEENIRGKVARDLHDDMGSMLSSIKIMSNIGLEKNDPTTAHLYFKSIRENANTMQESMSDMVWAINPENDTLERVIIRMKEFATEILEPLEINYTFEEEGNFLNKKLNLNTRKDFFLIYKEAVNNAAKYSACNNLTVTLKSDTNTILLSIEDDGKGYDTKVSNGGNGLKNMKHRANNIQAILQIESTIGKGTRIQLKATIT